MNLLAPSASAFAAQLSLSCQSTPPRAPHSSKKTQKKTPTSSYRKSLSVSYTERDSARVSSTEKDSSPSKRRLELEFRSPSKRVAREENQAAQPHPPLPDVSPALPIKHPPFLLKCPTTPERFSGRFEKIEQDGPNVKMLLISPTSKRLNTVTYTEDASQVVGKGTFGTVYKAQGNTHDGKRCSFVIKKQPPKFTEEEAIRLRKFQGTHVIRFINNTDTDIIMPRAQGSLENFLPFINKMSDEDRAKSVGMIMQHAASSLTGIHDTGYTHGDVKPGNMLLLEDKLVISDLGSVQKAREIKNNRSGTLIYMAPEFFEEAKTPLHITTQSDMWSLGCTLFVLLFPHARLSPVLWSTQYKDSRQQREAGCLKSQEEIEASIEDLPIPPLLLPYRDILLKLLCINPEERLTLSGLNMELSKFALTGDEQKELIRKMVGNTSSSQEQ
jgi:hypothetical protein